MCQASATCHLQALAGIASHADAFALRRRASPELHDMPAAALVAITTGLRAHASRRAPCVSAK